jgi:hypothetical protein
MAFVNVVGGNEIYNFRIHRLVHFYSRIWSFWCSNRDSANKLVSVVLCAATSRRDGTPTPARRAPRHSRPCAARGYLRPRSAVVPGRAAPEAARAPQRAGVRARATCRRATHVVPAERAPLGPAIRPRPPALVRRTTAGTSRRRHH